MSVLIESEARDDLANFHGARLAVGYFIDATERIGRNLDLDLLDALIFLTILWRNIREFVFTGRADSPAPLDARREASVYCMARDLSMPYETVRRRVVSLSEAGLCERTAKGYVVPPLTFRRPEFVAVLSEAVAATGQFVADLKAIGIKMPEPHSPPLDEIHRRMARLSVQFYVEGIAGLSKALELDPVRTLVLLTINRLNARELALETELAQAHAQAETPFPEDRRAMVSVYAIGKALRLPYETTRRHVQKLVDAGICIRDEAGRLLVPAASWDSAKTRAGIHVTWSCTRRFLNALAQLGMTAPTLMAGHSPPHSL